MRNAGLEFLSAVLIVSDDSRRLARFYRDQLGIPLRPEQHGETLQHWGSSWATFTLRFIHARTSTAIPTSASAPSSWPSWSSTSRLPTVTDTTGRRADVRAREGRWYAHDGGPRP
jgi:hypothetical protein